MYSTSFENCILLSESQQQKALLPILLSVAGSVIFVINLQSLNAACLIAIIPCGMVIMPSVSQEHLHNTSPFVE
jgi:hypothetical protein